MTNRSLTCCWKLLQWSQWLSQSPFFRLHCTLHNESLRSNQYVRDIIEIGKINLVPFSLIFMFLGWTMSCFVSNVFIICLGYACTDCLCPAWITACICNHWNISVVLIIFHWLWSYMTKVASDLWPGRWAFQQLWESPPCWGAGTCWWFGAGSAAPHPDTHGPTGGGSPVCLEKHTHVSLS